MELHLPLDFAIKTVEKSADPFLSTCIANNPYKRKVIVEATRLSKASIRTLHKMAEGLDKPWANDVRFMRASLSENTVPVFVDVTTFLPALQRYVAGNYIRGYVFRRGPHNAVMPFILHGAKTVQQRNTYYSPQVTINEPHFELSWSTGDSSTPQSSSFSFGPRKMQSFFDHFGIQYEEDIKVVGKGDNKHDILVNVKAENPVSIEDVFNYYELYVETQELHELYEKQLNRFLSFLPQYGKQFRVRGNSTSNQQLTVEGKAGRSILTTLPRILVEENEENSQARRRGLNRRQQVSFGQYGDDNSRGSWFVDQDSPDDTQWSKALVAQLQDVTLEDLQLSFETEPESASETPQRILVPLHPVLSIFHLERHAFFDVHVNNLAVYKYREGIDENLILPTELKELSRMLVASSSDEDAEDIIEGKSQATIVACIGDPGLGKTLMAEVMAEASKKPLYKVQAAQLGLDAESLEANLYRLLRRAERWGAVVMIDEANAYVHARGHDIKQNAVVGVFLRLLEYFRGTMLLTTNQTSEEGSGFDIDDAILSRCTAVFRFVLPTPELATRIWKLQAKLLNLEISDETIAKLVARHQLSGRSIRHLLKLSGRWAAEKSEPLALKHFTQCEKHIPKTASEVAAQKQHVKEL